MFSNLINGLYNYFENLPFDYLVYAVLGAYAGMFLVTFVLCFCSKRIKQADKRPFLCFTNAFTALVLAVFLLKCELGQSITASVIFWVAGYVLYGLLRLISATKASSPARAAAGVVQTRETAPPVSPDLPNSAPVAPKNSVRLEHAAAVTDKLLTKNLSKTDRQELEKLKNTLAVLQIKGSLTPAEAEILNENFNMLLKLMAKYNV